MFFNCKCPRYGFHFYTHTESMYIIIRHNVLCEYAIFYNHFTNMCNDILNSECAKSTIEDRTKNPTCRKILERNYAPTQLFCVTFTQPHPPPFGRSANKKLYP